MSDIKALADRLREWADDIARTRFCNLDDAADLRRAAAILDHLAAAPGPLREVVWRIGHPENAAWVDALADLTGEQSDGE